MKGGNVPGLTGCFELVGRAYSTRRDVRKPAIHPGFLVKQACGKS